MLEAISPVDGRYRNKTAELSPYFSEYALIKYRVHVEIQYFIALVDLPLPQLQEIDRRQLEELQAIARDFNPEHAEQIKQIERTTNHDVKAVEYFLKEQFDAIGLGPYKEFIHFGLTSQDINNTAIPLSLKQALENVYLPAINQVVGKLESLARDWLEVPMLARTHGQPASPTTLGKELLVFVNRLTVQLELLQTIAHKAKFGGATGNFNAHFTAYPETDWHEFGRQFVENYLGLSRSYPTTQIEHYDNLAALFQAVKRINTIFIDLCRDIWTYISIEYFGQKVIRGEIGSSAMPHKVNPIDFENAEGNLGLANAIFTHLADKLPVSRLQRDLTDSTVLRNVGVPFGHSLIACKSMIKGFGKLLLNESKLRQDLADNWMVVAEGIQNILRREGFEKPYEALLDLTRGKAAITREDIHAFIDGLNLDEEVKMELKEITPFNYTGRV